MQNATAAQIANKAYLLDPRQSFCKLSLQITCPHPIIIGGFSSVACSFETGQAKIEWNLVSSVKLISTYFL
jgi:hypothetical protein